MIVALLIGLFIVSIRIQRVEATVTIEAMEA